MVSLNNTSYILDVSWSMIWLFKSCTILSNIPTEFGYLIWSTMRWSEVLTFLDLKMSLMWSVRFTDIVTCTVLKCVHRSIGRDSGGASSSLDPQMRFEPIYIDTHKRKHTQNTHIQYVEKTSLFII